MRKEELKWTERDTRAIEAFKKELEEGRSIGFSYHPMECMVEFINIWDLKVKKDEKGNITIDVYKRKK